MKREVFAIMAFAVVALSLNACSSGSEDGGGDVVLLNKNEDKKQIAASDNGYCPLLPYPYDPRSPTLQEGEQERIIENPDGSVRVRITRQPDGSIEISGGEYPDYSGLLECENREELEAKANALRDSVLPGGTLLRDSIMPGGKPYLSGVPNYSYCDNISKAQLDSLRVIYDAREKRADSLRKIEEAWQEEVWRVRTDPTRIAAVTFSKGQTVINLSPVFVDFELNIMRLKDSKKNDTLYINVVPGKNGGYATSGMSNCPISLDIALNYIIDNDIKVVVFEARQIFQIKRQ